MQSGVLDSYPFDPLGQLSESTELKEIKNGRWGARGPYRPTSPHAPRARHLGKCTPAMIMLISRINFGQCFAKYVSYKWHNHLRTLHGFPPYNAAFKLLPSLRELYLSAGSLWWRL